MMNKSGQGGIADTLTKESDTMMIGAALHAQPNTRIYH